ncbi:hypothetical protein GYMLUDRAFT_60024 [Collybiopsis luxurians FD-317 M1]|uniref:Uncharacterized protein n=1 Tax=Collybiopsis luxurians FD-317 M1 TaxID=944289 RepID=A0A0D0B7G8_9AGAR|nr:hypothetical protein GYMLUDRAFT_60024 [Collybiopsis luxurians FD-317 M1]
MTAEQRSTSLKRKQSLDNTPSLSGAHTNWDGWDYASVADPASEATSISGGPGEAAATVSPPGAGDGGDIFGSQPHSLFHSSSGSDGGIQNGGPLLYGWPQPQPHQHLQTSGNIPSYSDWNDASQLQLPLQGQGPIQCAPPAGDQLPNMNDFSPLPRHCWLQDQQSITPHSPYWVPKDDLHPVSRDHDSSPPPSIPAIPTLTVHVPQLHLSSDSTNTDSGAPEVQHKQSRGQPPKVKVSTSAEPALQKKRGRPRKNKDVPLENSSDPQAVTRKTKGKKRSASNSEVDDRDAPVLKRQKKGVEREVPATGVDVLQPTRYPAVGPELPPSTGLDLPQPTQYPAFGPQRLPSVQPPHFTALQRRNYSQEFSRRLKTIPESHRKVIEFFVRGGKVSDLKLPSQPITCRKFFAIDEGECYCQRCMTAFLFFWAAIIVNDRVFHSNKGNEMTWEAAWCPPVLEWTLSPPNHTHDPSASLSPDPHKNRNHDGDPVQHIRLLHILNLQDELRKNYGFADAFSLPPNCFVKDEFTGGRYWWHNGLNVVQEMWPKMQDPHLPEGNLKDRLTVIQCPEELASLWIVSQAKNAWRCGYLIDVPIRECIRILQGEVLTTSTTDARSEALHSLSSSELLPQQQLTYWYQPQTPESISPPSLPNPAEAPQPLSSSSSSEQQFAFLCQSQMPESIPSLPLCLPNPAEAPQSLSSSTSSELLPEQQLTYSYQPQTLDSIPSLPLSLPSPAVESTTFAW